MSKTIRHPTKAEFAEALGIKPKRLDYIDLNSISLHGLADLLGMFSEDSFSSKEEWDYYIHRKDRSVVCVSEDSCGQIDAIMVEEAK